MYPDRYLQRTQNSDLEGHLKPAPESDHYSKNHDLIKAQYKVIRRNGSVMGFDKSKIYIALSKAFLAVKGQSNADSSSIRDIINTITEQVTQALMRRKLVAATFHIEEIQDQVELALMRGGYHDVARGYVLYREERTRVRQANARDIMPDDIHITAKDGRRHLLDIHTLSEQIDNACDQLPDTDSKALLKSILKELYDGISQEQLNKALYMSSCAWIDREPQYSKVSARLLLDRLRAEIFDRPVYHSEMEQLYGDYLHTMIKKGIEAELLDSRMAQKFDLKRLARELHPQRDLQFDYIGLQTLYDRYFLNIDGQRIEMPQTFFMRVAMGLSLLEDNPTESAISFYHLLSCFRFMCSTPTLFNAGTTHSQLSSCYLTTVDDDLSTIFEAYQENALLAKYAGGLGNDWTPVRAMGAHIKGTNGKSQGVIPFLKIVNDTAVAVNQGGKRKGAICTYLETWHLDILDFLDLRKNTGDERRRTHDINTANWIPDLFMKRVYQNGDWFLFSPSDAPDLHSLFGEVFEKRYTTYESLARMNKIHHKKINAVELWRKMLTMLFETGHPWITFKDTCNIRSPQQHAGAVHSSNLCTEITLNTSASEIAVCNLGSVNLLAHLKEGALDQAQLSRTITTAMRMLDNVIDINFYAVGKAKNANTKHRPVGLGIMGFQDCLYELGIAYNSPQAIQWADESTEIVCYEAYWASTILAKERGAYSSFEGSLWSQDILPQDSLRLLAKARDNICVSDDSLHLNTPHLNIDLSQRLDWQSLRDHIKQHGMRNSNCVAIAPTATIANITGVSASIEPTYQNIYVKSNLSGNFTISNRYLVADLKALNLWDDVMLQDIKYFDGRLDNIDRIPTAVKTKYPTAFDIDPSWLIECAARRQKWIDQAQSLNLYLDQPSGKKLDEMYKLAWQRGLKTTYYLRTMGASSTEKYTTRAGAHNAVAANGSTNGNGSNHQGVCRLGEDDQTCEVCQ